MTLKKLSYFQLIKLSKVDNNRKDKEYVEESTKCYNNLCHIRNNVLRNNYYAEHHDEYYRYKQSADVDKLKKNVLNPDKNPDSVKNKSTTNDTNEKSKDNYKIPEKITTELNLSELLSKDFMQNISSDCSYFIEGDMTKNGHIECKKHGYINEYTNFVNR